MNVTIEDSCIACGACESICDAVFSVEDKAIVNAANVAANEDAVQEAAGGNRIYKKYLRKISSGILFYC